MALNSKDASFSGFGVPNIHVKNVILESTGNGPTWAQLEKQDPHIDHGHEMVPNLDHVINATTNKLSSLNLRVTLNLVFKDTISGGEEAWFESDMVLNSYKVVIAQSTNPVASGALMDKDIYYQAPKMLFEEQSSFQGFYATTKSIFDIVGGTKDDIRKKIKTKMLDNGLVSRELHATTSFVVDTHNPKHLSFFLIPFFDIAGFMGATGQTPNEIGQVFEGSEYEALESHKKVLGKPVAEIIIQKHANANSGLIFYDSENNPYNGPVHWMPATSPNESGYWMMGESHNDPNIYYPGSEINATLKAVKVANVKIQDFRMLNKIDKLNLNFSAIENSLLLIKDNIQNNVLPTIKPGNFTGMKLSRDGSSQARFFFGMDFYSLAKKSSAYPSLYQLASSDLVERFLANTTIHSMKIKRRRVKETYCENQLIDSCSDRVPFEDDQGFEVDIIAVSGDIKTNLKTRNYFKSVSSYTTDSEKISSTGGSKKNKVVGALREVKLKLKKGNKSSSGLRHFTGIDYSVIDATDGIYQYGIEMEIQDGSAIVMGEIAMRANKALKPLRNYLYELQRNNDPHTNSFSSIMESLETSKVNSYREIVTRALESIEEILKLLTKSASTQNMLATIYLAAIPETGSPAGVEMMIKILDSLRQKVVNLLGSKKTGKNYKSSSKHKPNPARTGHNKHNVLKLSKIEYYFPEAFDADVIRHAGYEFLSLANNLFGAEASGLSTSGLLTVTAEQYDIRTKMEASKFFADDVVNYSDLKFIDANPQYNSKDTLDTTRYRYLAPSHVLLPNLEKPVELLVGLGGSPNFDTLRDAKLLADIYAHNEYGKSLRDFKIKTNKNSSNMSEDEQRLERKLSNILFARGCTIEHPLTAFEAMLLQGSDASEAGLNKPIIVGQLFGKDNEAPPEKNKTDSPKDKLSDPYDAPHIFSPADPNSVLLSLVRPNHWSGMSNSLKFYDLYDKNYSFFDNIKSGNTDMHFKFGGVSVAMPSMFATRLSSAPNHLKYWLLAASKYVENKVVGENNLIKYDFPPELDVLKSPKWQPTIWLHFKNLMQIQILTSYNANDKKTGTFAMKSENWKPLEISDVAANGSYLCKMTPLSGQSQYQIKVDDPSLQLPVYHEYFMIKTGATVEESIGTTSTISSELKRAMNRSNTVAAGSENVHTAIIGKTADATLAKKYLFTAIEEIANTTEPLGRLKPKTAAADIQELAGKPVNFVQQTLNEKTKTDTMGGGSGGTY